MEHLKASIETMRPLMHVCQLNITLMCMCMHMQRW